MTTNKPAGYGASPRCAAIQLTRSSFDSSGSEAPRISVYTSALWTRLRKAWRYVFFFSIVCLVVGVLLVVVGFSEAAVVQPYSLPLRVVGVGLLVVTASTWVFGSVCAHLWQRHLQRLKDAIDLRERVHLHAMMIDIIHTPVFTPVMLGDPYTRRQLLRSMRTRQLPLHDSLSTCSRGSRQSRRQSYTSTDTTARRVCRSRDRSFSWDEPNTDLDQMPRPTFALPGIRISRFDFFDYSDGHSLPSCSSQASSRGIVVQKDKLSRLSWCPSDYSLTASRSSRSSHASSWNSCGSADIYMRESDFDADISQDSREFQLDCTASDTNWPRCRRSSVDKYHRECDGELGRRQTTPNLAVPCRLYGAYNDTGRLRYDENLWHNVRRGSVVNARRPADVVLQRTLSGTRRTSIGGNIAEPTVDQCVTHDNHCSEYEGTKRKSSTDDQKSATRYSKSFSGDRHEDVEYCQTSDPLGRRVRLPGLEQSLLARSRQLDSFKEYSVDSTDHRESKSATSECLVVNGNEENGVPVNPPSAISRMLSILGRTLSFDTAISRGRLRRADREAKPDAENV